MAYKLAGGIIVFICFLLAGYLTKPLPLLDAAIALIVTYFAGVVAATSQDLAKEAEAAAPSEAPHGK